MLCSRVLIISKIENRFQNWFFICAHLYAGLNTPRIKLQKVRPLLWFRYELLSYQFELVGSIKAGIPDGNLLGKGYNA